MFKKLFTCQVLIPAHTGWFGEVVEISHKPRANGWTGKLVHFGAKSNIFLNELNGDKHDYGKQIWPHFKT